MFRNWHAFYSKLATPKLQQWWWNEKKNTWQKNIRIYSFIFAKLHTNGLYLHLLLTTIYFNFSSTGSFKDLYPPAEFMNHVIAINEKGKVRVRSAIMIYIYRDLCKFFVKKYDHLFYERKREKEREGEKGELSTNHLNMHGVFHSQNIFCDKINNSALGLN